MRKSGQILSAFTLLMTLVIAHSVARADAGQHTIDLLKFVDPKVDAVRGHWSMQEDGLVGDGGEWDHFEIPYQPPEEYDFRVVFTRLTNTDPVDLICYAGGHQFIWLISGIKDTLCGFDMINGVGVGKLGNPTSTYGNHWLVTGRQATTIVKVRKDHVEAYLDGKLICRWKTDYSGASLFGEYAMHDPNCLGLANYGSKTIFQKVELTEITGSGKFLRPTDNTKKPDQSEETTKLQDDTAQDDKPMSGPTTRVSKPISTIKALEVYTTDSGMMLGQTSEMVLTVTRGDTSKATSVRYVMPVGDQMIMARDEAQRYIRVAYPNWYADTAELTFEDKYVGHDGGSNGTAVGTLILSAIQGFDIDSDAAITGDISANGKVRAIGGISAKIHGATASKCTVVAVPMENYDQLVDAMVYSGPKLVTDIQVIGISTLDDAAAVMRIDRDAGLAKAVSLFDGIQQSIKKSPGYLHTKEAQDRLVEVLQLAPHHLSAKLLLMVAQNNAPKTLSAAASEYYTFVAVRAMLPILDARAKSDKIQVPSAAVKQGLADLKNLRPLADESIRPLIDAWSKFIWGCSMYQAGNLSGDALDKQSQAIDDAMAKLSADQDLMQKMLKEGM